VAHWWPLTWTSPLVGEAPRPISLFDLAEIRAVVEKPEPEKAPSTLCIIGRYILQPEIFAELGRQEPA